MYTGFKALADSLAAQLTRAGVDAAAYHASKNLAQREAVQSAFLGNRLRVVVATVAFGMVRRALLGEGAGGACSGHWLLVAAYWLLPALLAAVTAGWMRWAPLCVLGLKVSPQHHSLDKPGLEASSHDHAVPSQLSSLVLASPCSNPPGC